MPELGATQFAAAGSEGMAWDCSTLYDMSTTLTIRTDDALGDALRLRAQAQGKTLSQLVREILKSAVTERPMRERAGHLKGTLELPLDGGESWRDQIRERNWRR